MFLVIQLALLALATACASSPTPGPFAHPVTVVFLNHFPGRGHGRMDGGPYLITARMAAVTWYCNSGVVGD